MPSQDLEFRGINLSHLGMYFEELGAKKISDSFPFIFQAENWRSEIIKEEELSFTSVFKVNAIHIRFIARSQQELEELIRDYRYKTFRVGG